MSTFAELAARASGVGVAYLLEGSTDLFATTPYLFSTQDGLFGGSTAYDSRIVGMGDLQRGFGVNGVLAASTVAVSLSNTDGGADFLITSAAVLFKVRWRLKVALYDTAAPSDLATKVLGVFVNLDNPARTASTVELNLADDSFGMAAELAIPPTWGEALASAVDPATTEPPCPIAMGGGTIPAQLAPYDVAATTVKLILCATTDTSAIDPDEVESLTISGGPISYPNANDSMGVASTEIAFDTANVPTQYPLWSAAKTASLTKDGRTWKVLYVDLYTQNLLNWLSARTYLAQTTITTQLQTFYVNVGLEYFNNTILPQLNFSATGPRFSSRTYTANGLNTTVRAPDIVYDLLRYYSRGLDASQVDVTSFTAASAAFPMFWFRSSYYFTNFLQDVTTIANGGALGRQTNNGAASAVKGILHNAISELCQGGLFDVVTDWNGKFVAHVLANTFDLQTATPTPIDETLMKGIRDRVPSVGERWAPYNRIIFQSNGRIVDNTTAIADWGVVLSRTINDSAVRIDEAFSGTDFGIGTFGGIGTLESAVRPVITWEYPLDALNLELGEFIAVTWSRGAGVSAWSSHVFRVESLTLHPKTCTVTVTAVYIDDLANEVVPYLLDDETLLVRAKSGGCLLFMQDGNSAIGDPFTGYDFVAMGVQEGDILILRDSTQAAGVFTRNRALRIVGIIDAQNFEVEATDLDFDFPTSNSVANADWSIVRGATTYPTAVSDPTNYPSNGWMYGKQSETGLFSDTSTANILQAG